MSGHQAKITIFNTHISSGSVAFSLIVSNSESVFLFKWIHEIGRNKFTQFSRFNPCSLSWPRLHVLRLWKKQQTAIHQRKAHFIRATETRRASLLRGLASSVKVVCFVFIYQEQVMWTKQHKARYIQKVILHSLKLHTHGLHSNRQTSGVLSQHSA